MTEYSKRVKEVLDAMREDGDRFPNLGEADRRLRTRKEMDNDETMDVANVMIDNMCSTLNALMDGVTK